MIDKKKQGKKNRKKGKTFEMEVRRDLESKGWIVTKWSNNLKQISDDPEDGKGYEMIPAKPQYNPFFKRIIGEGSGFPDFIAFTPFTVNFYTGQGVITKVVKYSMMAVECKTDGYLKKEERDKCDWYLKMGIFSQINIAKKDSEGGIKYEDYTERKVK